MGCAFLKDTFAPLCLWSEFQDIIKNLLLAREMCLSIFVLTIIILMVAEKNVTPLVGVGVFLEFPKEGIAMDSGNFNLIF